MAGTLLWAAWATLYEGGSLTWLKDWQTLAAAFVASAAVAIAVINTNRSLDHAEGLEAHRRTRKHAAVRAVLPLALSEIHNYAAQSAHALDDVLSNSPDDPLPPGAVGFHVIQQLPAAALNTLTEFIEYSDTVDVGMIETIVACIQIFNSRIRLLINDSQTRTYVERAVITRHILEAGFISAGISRAFAYARRQSPVIPTTIEWPYLNDCIQTMSLTNYDFVAEIRARMTQPEGPLEALF